MARATTSNTKKTTTPDEDNKEVAKVQPGGAVAVAMPDFMKGLGGQGLEALSASDFETPRIKLLQALSPECEEFENAKAGCFWHTATNQNLGKTILVTPIYVDMRAILWRPRPEGGILARSDDGVHWSPPNAEFEVKLEKSGKIVKWRTKPTVAASGLLDWGSSDPEDQASQPAATKMYNLVLAFGGDLIDVPPGVFTMARSMVGPARKFLGKLKMAAAPSYGTVYEVSSFLDDNSAGQKFHNVKFTPAGFVSDQETFSRNKGLYDSIRDKGLTIRDEGQLHDDAFVGETLDAETPGAPAY